MYLALPVSSVSSGYRVLKFNYIPVKIDVIKNYDFLHVPGVIFTNSRTTALHGAEQHN